MSVVNFANLFKLGFRKNNVNIEGEGRNICANKNLSNSNQMLEIVFCNITEIFHSIFCIQQRKTIIRNSKLRISNDRYHTRPKIYFLLFSIQYE